MLLTRSSRSFGSGTLSLSEIVQGPLASGSERSCRRHTAWSPPVPGPHSISSSVRPEAALFHFVRDVVNCCRMTSPGRSTVKSANVTHIGIA